MLLEILQNPEDLSIEVGFLLSLQQTPVLAVTEPEGDPETTSSTGDKRVCLTTIQLENEPFSEINHVTVLSSLRP